MYIYICNDISSRRYGVSKIMYQVYYITYNIEYRMYTSRVRASQVTEVSRYGSTYKDKRVPIGTAPDCLLGTAVDCVISCCYCLLIWLAPDISASSQTFRLLAACLLLVWTCLFSLTFLPHILAR